MNDTVRESLLRAIEYRAEELSDHFKIHGWPIRGYVHQLLLDEYDIDIVQALLDYLPEGIIYAPSPDKVLGGYPLAYQWSNSLYIAIYSIKDDRIFAAPIRNKYAYGQLDEYEVLGTI